MMQPLWTAATLLALIACGCTATAGSKPSAMTRAETCALPVSVSDGKEAHQHERLGGVQADTRLIAETEGTGFAIRDPHVEFVGAHAIRSEEEALYGIVHLYAAGSKGLLVDGRVIRFEATREVQPRIGGVSLTREPGTGLDPPSARQACRPPTIPDYEYFTSRPTYLPDGLYVGLWRRKSLGETILVGFYEAAAARASPPYRVLGSTAQEVRLISLGPPGLHRREVSVALLTEAPIGQERVWLQLLWLPEALAGSSKSARAK
jgi:hypothetical protein